MVALSAIVLLTAVGTLVADRVSFFQKDQIRQGILFGLLAIAANTFSVDIHNMGISVGLIDAPPIVAGLLFGPIAGIIAGLIAAAERALTPLWGAGQTTWLACSCATFFVSCCIAGLRHFIFDNQRPHIIPGVITAAFGEVLHLAFFFVFEMNDFSLTCEVFFCSAEPMILGSSAAMALSCLACWRPGQKKPKSLDKPVPSFLLFAIAFSTLIRFAFAGAERRLDEELNIAVERFDNHMSKVIGLFMYRCANHIMQNIEDPYNCSAEILERGAWEHGLDEVNIITNEEKIVMSNREELVNTTFPRSNPFASEFYNLLDGKELVVTQGFRYGINVSSEYSRYLGIPFPKRNAFLEVGYTFDRLGKEMEHTFLPAIVDAAIYHTGYILTIDENGVIINKVRNRHDLRGKTISDIGLDASQVNNPEKRLFFARIMGEMCRCTVDRHVGNNSVIAVLPLKDIYWPMLRLVFFCGLVLFTISLMFRWTIVKTSRNQRMIDELRKKNEEQKEHEMNLARSVQISELKTEPTHSDCYTIYSLIQPAREIGGDSYDYFEQENGKVVFGISDVSGKGIYAAIFMMKVRTALRILGTQGKSVLEFMETTNNILCRNNDTMMFVTCWAGSYDPATQELEYVSAGHNPPFLVKKNGTAQMLNCRKTPPLGIRSGYSYHVQKCRLEHGDRIFVYTDGVTEAKNASDQLYGTDRLQALLAKCGKDFNINLIEEVQRSVKEFTGCVEQFDDITMLTMNVK